ncbi:MAG: SpoIIE family protein phosphatase [Acidimicrobiia bacterium]
MTTSLVVDRATTLEGPSLWLVRAGWFALAALVTAVAAASFDAFFGGDLGLVESQGALAVQPELARQLEERLLGAGVLKAGQIAVHVTGFVLFFVTGALLFLRKSRDWVATLSSATLLAAGAALFAPSSVLAQTRPDWEVAVHSLGVFDAGPEFWRSIAGVAIVLFAFLFPEGRFAAKWMRVVAVLFSAEVVLWAIFPGIAVFDVAEWPESLQVVWTLGLALAVVVAQVYRYFRVSSTHVRSQTRLVVISLFTVVAVFGLIWIIDPDLSQNFDLGLVVVTPRLQAIYDLNLLSLLTLAVVLFPVSIVVSVTRYRLWDMDLILNRALVYGTLTGVIGLALVVAAVIAGNLAESTLGPGFGVALTGMLMVGLFQPLRTRVQSQVDRRFYRQKYDADRTVDAFAERIRDQSDVAELERDLIDVVGETLSPSAVDLYLELVDEGASAEHDALADVYLDAGNSPIPLAAQSHAAAIALVTKGVDLVVPLVSHKELVGVLQLGPRLGDRAYSGLDHQLLRRLAESAAPVIRYAQLVEQQAEQAAERQRLQQELQLAESIQRDLLPKDLPQLEGWELAAHYQPAREVSGDLYDFIELPDGRWAVVVADVSGKGVPAAMVMATCRSMLRGVATASGTREPGRVLERVNDLLVPDTPESMFVTCLYAVVDPVSGVLSYANAGHNLPLIWSDEIREVKATGMPLGLMPGMKYEEVEVVIQPGESLLLYSDGLTEAHDLAGQMFGKPRLMTWIRDRRVTQGLLGDLMAELAEFTAPANGLEDDVTLVALRRLSAATGPAPPPGRVVVDEFTLSSEAGADRIASQRVGSVVGALIDDRQRERLETAVAEATLNAVEHGNKNRPELPVHFLVATAPGRLFVSITDTGHLEEVLESQSPDLEERLSGERSPRGWGLLLIENMVDEVRTIAGETHTTVELVVHLHG